MKYQVEKESTIYLRNNKLGKASRYSIKFETFWNKGYLCQGGETIYFKTRKDAEKFLKEYLKLKNG